MEEGNAPVGNLPMVPDCRFLVVGSFAVLLGAGNDTETLDDAVAG